MREVIAEYKGTEYHGMFHGFFDHLSVADTPSVLRTGGIVELKTGSCIVVAPCYITFKTPASKKENKESPENVSQHPQAANCHLHNPGEKCRQIYQLVCKEQCCIVPCQSTAVR